MTKLITLFLCLVTTSTYAQSKKNKVKADTLKTSKSVTPQIFKGLDQYRTWTVGINTGVLAGSVLTGGTNDYHVNDIKAGFGISVRKQFGTVLGLQLDGLTGHVAGSAPRDRTQFIQSYDTELGYSGTLSVVANLGGLSYMKRAHKVNFYVLGGMGFMGFAPKVTYKNGSSFDTKGYNGVFKNKVYIHEFTTFAGVGIKFKLSDRFNLNTGYTENFIDNDFLDGIHNVQVNGRDYQKDKFSYGYAGLEYSIGKKSKPNIDWINPAALIYDAQVEQSIHDEFVILKERTERINASMIELKKDADSDGVPDWLDKCPNTPANTKVDASGCPVLVVVPAVVTQPVSDTVVKITVLDRSINVTPKQNVQFAYNSAEITQQYFSNLNNLAKAMKTNAAKNITLTGYASHEGSEKYNVWLSQKRANAVKAYLVKAGADEKQITIKVLGITKPVANNAHEEGRVINRRVEIN